MRIQSTSSRLSYAVLLPLLMLCVQGSAQQQSGKRTIVHPGRLLDVRTGKVLTNQAIVIQDDKIERVAPASEIQASANATVIDLPNATVLPGLIDAHTHLTYNPQFGYESRVLLRCETSMRADTVTWPCAMQSMPVTCRARACW